MPSQQFIFDQLLAHVRSTRPSVAAELERHQADILTIANEQASDEERIEALLRAGASTIDWARATERPVGGLGMADQRLAVDLALLHAALELAEDPRRQPKYRRWAKATAYGIGMVIAAGLSHMEVPGGLNIQIWRACGTRQYQGTCDDELCRICQEHDRARAEIREEASNSDFPWGKVLGGGAMVAILLAIFKPWK